MALTGARHARAGSRASPLKYLRPNGIVGARGISGASFFWDPIYDGARSAPPTKESDMYIGGGLLVLILIIILLVLIF